MSVNLPSSLSFLYPYSMLGCSLKVALFLFCFCFGGFKRQVFIKCSFLKTHINIMRQCSRNTPILRLIFFLVMSLVMTVTSLCIRTSKSLNEGSESGAHESAMTQVFCTEVSWMSVTLLKCVKVWSLAKIFICVIMTIFILLKR